MDASQWIRQLELTPHPEGGYYRETYHSDVWLQDAQTLHKHGGERRSATSIYFLLEGRDVSRFHRLKSDEIWYFHAGSALTVHVITEHGDYQTHALGLDPSKGQTPQLLIPRLHIFGATLDTDEAEPAAGSAFALVSCMVSPGFDFADFELFDRADLLKSYPHHANIIHRLT